MSKRTTFKEKFKGLGRMPMPIFITDIDGVVLFKNEFANSNYNFRIGSNVLRYADSYDSDIVRKLSVKGLSSTVVLKCDAWACVCAVVPKCIDGEICCVYSSIPYAYNFIDGASTVSSSAADEKEKYFDELEKLIANMLDNVDGDAYQLDEREARILKYNAQKLMRLERRLRERLFTGGRAREYNLNASYFCSDSVELCSFSDIMAKNINSLSSVLGFYLVYLPERNYSICKCRSYDLAKLFVYISVFCLKFGEGRDTVVSVGEKSGDSILIFKPRIRNTVLENAASFDLEYITACANSLGFKLVCARGEEYVESISVHISSGVASGENALSAASYLFDISADFIKNVFAEAQRFIGTDGLEL